MPVPHKDYSVACFYNRTSFLLVKRFADGSVPPNNNSLDEGAEPERLEPVLEAAHHQRSWHEFDCSPGNLLQNPNGQNVKAGLGAERCTRRRRSSALHQAAQQREKRGARAHFESCNVRN